MQIGIGAVDGAAVEALIPAFVSHNSVHWIRHPARASTGSRLIYVAIAGFHGAARLTLHWEYQDAAALRLYPDEDHKEFLETIGHSTSLQPQEFYPNGLCRG